MSQALVMQASQILQGQVAVTAEEPSGRLLAATGNHLYDERLMLLVIAMCVYHIV